MTSAAWASFCDACNSPSAVMISMAGVGRLSMWMRSFCSTWSVTRPGKAGSWTTWETGATSTDTITVRPAGTGSEVTYRAELEMQGVAKLAAPVMKLEFENLAGKTEKQLSEVLNSL